MGYVLSLIGSQQKQQAPASYNSIPFMHPCPTLYRALPPVVLCYHPPFFLLWQKITLLCSHISPFSTCFHYLIHLAYLGYRHVPPAFIIVYSFVAIIPNINDRGSLCHFYCLERCDKIIIALTFDDMRSQATSVGSQINRQGLHFRSFPIPGQHAVLWIDIACTEAFLPQRTAQSANALEAVVVQ